MDLDQATILRNLAQAKREKSNNRVSSTTLLATVTEFLNSDSQFIAVENVMPKSKLSAVVARFRTIVTENNVSDLVYPVIADDHVYLVKLAVDES